MKLPQKMIYLSNIDKKFQEKWSKDRDPLNIPHSFRMAICGRPNSGKSTVIKNIIMRINPSFDNIFLLHCDPMTQEWNDIPMLIKLSDLPPPDWWSQFRTSKNLLIIDDWDLKLKGEAATNLERCFGYVSSHCSLSIMITQQNFFYFPTAVKKNCNVFVCCARPHDLDALYCLGRRLGYNKRKMEAISNHAWKDDRRNSLWIDETSNSPYPMRINGYEMFNLK